MAHENPSGGRAAWFWASATTMAAPSSLTRGVLDVITREGNLDGAWSHFFMSSPNHAPRTGDIRVFAATSRFDGEGGRPSMSDEDRIKVATCAYLALGSGEMSPRDFVVCVEPGSLRELPGLFPNVKLVRLLYSCDGGDAGWDDPAMFGSSSFSGSGRDVTFTGELPERTRAAGELFELRRAYEEAVENVFYAGAAVRMHGDGSAGTLLDELEEKGADLLELLSAGRFSCPTSDLSRACSRSDAAHAMFARHLPCTRTRAAARLVDMSRIWRHQQLLYGIGFIGAGGSILDDGALSVDMGKAVDSMGMLSEILGIPALADAYANGVPLDDLIPCGCGAPAPAPGLIG